MKVGPPRTGYSPLGDNAFNNAVPAYFYPSIGGYSGARMSIYDELARGYSVRRCSRGETGEPQSYIIHA